MQQQEKNRDGNKEPYREKQKCNKGYEDYKRKIHRITGKPEWSFFYNSDYRFCRVKEGFIPDKHDKGTDFNGAGYITPIIICGINERPCKSIGNRYSELRQYPDTG
jgi:hypothetical protein